MLYYLILIRKKASPILPICIILQSVFHYYSFKRRQLLLICSKIILDSKKSSFKKRTGERMKKEKKLIVKDNRLIEANYKLSLQEQRFMLLLISMIKKDDEGFKSYRITAQEFADTIDKKNVYQTLATISDTLLSRVLSIYNKEEKSILKCNWISSFKYYEKKGFADVSFDPKLKDYLLRLKKSFTRYNLKAVARITSVYTIRIYELLKQYESIGKRTLTVKKLKEMLKIENKYNRYNNLKRKIILRAQDELEEKTDIAFDFVETKEGRKVTSLTFIIKQKNLEKAEEKELTGMNDDNKKMYSRLTDYFCLSKKAALEVIQRYKEDYINDVLDYVERQIEEKKVDNIGAYTSKALQEGWMDKQSQFEIESEEKKKKKQAEEERKAKERIQKEKKGEEIYGGLSAEERKKAVESIVEEGKDNFLQGKIDLFGFEDSPKSVKNFVYRKIAEKEEKTDST